MVVESAAKQAFMELAKADTSGDFERALKACNRILRNHPKETIAFKCKLVCLINVGKFEDALALVKKTPPSQMGDCIFEKAYIEYRLNENDKALETLGKGGDGDLRCLELKAQILYRLEKFPECLAIYRKLMKDSSDAYDNERRTNLLAVEAQLQAHGENQKRMDALDTYEQYYNSACQQIECGNFTEALKRLDKAEKMCRANMIEEGLGEEETEDEVAGVRVQRAFVLLALGQVDIALNICHEVLKNKPADSSVLATASNNCVAVRRDVNLSDARKRLKVPENKLSFTQRRVLSVNQALLHLASNQRDLCRRSADELRDRYALVEMAAVITAAIALRAREPQVAIAALREVPATPTVLLTLLHIHVTQDKLDDAIAVLDELPTELRAKPAVQSVAIALFEATGQHERALTVLRDAIAHAQETQVQCRLLDQCAGLCQKIGDAKGELDCLQRLNQLEPGNVTVTARLIKAFSAIDVKKAHTLSENALPGIDTSAVNVDELEKSDWILYGERYRSKKEAKKEIEDTEIVTGKLRRFKRKRKLRLPKNIDPNIPIDPERWLPRQERAAYRKHRGKKHQRDRDVGRGTQGAVAASPHLEAGNKVESSPKPAVVAAEGPRQQRPAGAVQPKKKKPKKGGKW